MCVGVVLGADSPDGHVSVLGLAWLGTALQWCLRDSRHRFVHQHLLVLHSLTWSTQNTSKSLRQTGLHRLKAIKFSLTCANVKSLTKSKRTKTNKFVFRLIWAHTCGLSHVGSQFKTVFNTVLNCLLPVLFLLALFTSAFFKNVSTVLVRTLNRY